MLRDKPTRVLQREHKLAVERLRRIDRSTDQYRHFKAYVGNLEGELENRQVRFTKFEE